MLIGVINIPRSSPVIDIKTRKWMKLFNFSGGFWHHMILKVERNRATNFGRVKEKGS